MKKSFLCVNCYIDVIICPIPIIIQSTNFTKVIRRCHVDLSSVKVTDSDQQHRLSGKRNGQGLVLPRSLIVHVLFADVYFICCLRCVEYDYPIHHKLVTSGR